MFHLPKALALLCCLLLVAFTAPQAAAQERNCGTGLGVNLAGQWDKNSFAQTADTVGPCGTVTIMAHSSELAKLQEIFSYNDQLREQGRAVQIVVRDASGRARSGEDAISWAATLGSIDTQSRVNFMPVNEPFRDFGGGQFLEWSAGAGTKDGIAQEVTSYIQALHANFQAAEILDRKVNLWSPMINQFDGEFTQNVQRLLEADPNFPNYFSGMTMNLYARYVDGQLTGDARENGIGYREVLRDVWKLPNADTVPVLAAEFGVLDGFPQFVTYPPQLISAFIKDYALGNWASDPNFYGGSILFYNPDTNEPWLFGSEVQTLLEQIAADSGFPEGLEGFNEQAFRSWLAAVLSRIVKCPQGGFAPSGNLCSQTSPFLLFSGTCPPGVSCVVATYEKGCGDPITLQKTITVKKTGQTTITQTANQERGGGDIAPVERVKTPNTTFVDWSRFFPFIFPSELLQKIREGPAPANLLPGRVFFPPQGITADEPALQAQLEEVELKSEGFVDYAQSPSWTKTIADTFRLRAVAVPGKGAKPKIGVVAEDPPGEEENEPGRGCPPEGGAQAIDPLSAISTQGNVLVQAPNLFDRFRQFISSISQNFLGFLGLNQSQQIAARIHIGNANFAAGTPEVEEQLVGPQGLFSIFFPREIGPKAENEKNPTNLAVSASPTEVDPYGINFKNVGSLKDEYFRVQQALRPLDFGFSSFSDPGTRYYSAVDRETGELLYTIDYMGKDFDISEEDKQRIVKYVQSRPGSGEFTKIATYFDRVVSEARAAGINPLFALTVWIEESGAAPQVRGENGEIIQVTSEFGCDVGLNFSESLNCFKKFTAQDHPDGFPEWLSYFCGPNIQPVCFDRPNTPPNLRDIYNKLVSLVEK